MDDCVVGQGRGVRHSPNDDRDGRRDRHHGPKPSVGRTEQPGGKSSPEELAAAAHASCFSMALAMALGQQATPPQRLQVEAKVTLAEVDGQPTITTSHLQVRGQVPGIDADKFTAIVEEAATSCPVSRLFAGADITIEAQLDESA